MCSEFHCSRLGLSPRGFGTQWRQYTRTVKTLAIVIHHVMSRMTRLVMNPRTTLAAHIFIAKQLKFDSPERRLRFNITWKRLQLLTKESNNYLVVSDALAAPVKCLSTWKAAMLLR